MRYLAAVFALLVAGEAIAQEQPAKFRLRWGDLPRLTLGHTVAMTLPDGTRLQGTVLGFEPDAMLLDVKKTSDGSAWPKGRVAVPRAAITVFRLTKRTGATWRFVGTAVGGGIGALIAIPLALYGNNEGNGRFASAGVAVAGGLTAIGYLAGHSADHKSMLIELEGVN